MNVMMKLFDVVQHRGECQCLLQGVQVDLMWHKQAAAFSVETCKHMRHHWLPKVK